MEDSKLLNKLVFDYLEKHASKKVANDFVKSVGKDNIKDEVDGMPSIPEMVNELIKNDSFPSSAKDSAKRRRKEVSSDQDENNNKVPEGKKVKEVEGNKENSINNNDLKGAKEKEKKPTNAAVAKEKDNEESSSDDDSSDDEKEQKSRSPQKIETKKVESSSEDDSSDEDLVKDKKEKATANPIPKDENSSSSEESDSEKDEDKKPVKVEEKKPKGNSSSNTDSKSDKKEATKKKTHPKSKKEDSSDSNDSEDNDDTTEIKQNVEEDSSFTRKDSNNNIGKNNEKSKKDKKKKGNLNEKGDSKITNHKEIKKSPEGKTGKYSKNEGEYYIKMSGVPYKATEQELKDFFNGGDKPHRVKHSLNNDGRNSGHAFAAFHTKEAAEKAMLKDKQHMGSRYISLTRSDSFGPSSDAKGEGNSSEFCVKMTGAPFQATEKDIRDFFGGEIAPTGIQFISNEKGRPSGEVLVDFETDEAVQKALLKDREYIGSRYVFLKRYTGKDSENERKSSGGNKIGNENRAFGDRGKDQRGRGGSSKGGGQRGRGGRGGPPRGGFKRNSNFSATGANRIKIDSGPGGKGSNKKISFGDD